MHPERRHANAANSCQGARPRCGFRDALRAEALRQGVRGWVRNCADGSVEALLQGDDAAVERVITWARRGPPLAQVRALDEQAVDTAFDRPYPGFERWPSA